ncbi:AI-2E family transporter [Mesobacterium pallidum]|uniref:AI-2E family transporter n=1 Tax=Mesobacterium pallidum TaxID=2872037 RepID=UPI001EE29F13|nr:AI-2E family transporter [Mesobacterium pallidum]
MAWAVLGIFLILFVASLILARDFLMPIVLALLLSLVFAPLRRALERTGLPSALAATLIVLSLVLAVTAALMTIASPASRWISDAPQIVEKVEDRLRSIRPFADRLREVGHKIDDIVEGDAEEQDAGPRGPEVPRDARPEPERPDVNGDGEGDTIVVRDEGSASSTTLGSALYMAPLVIAQMAFTTILLFFLMASGDMFLEKIVTVARTRTDRERAVNIVFDIERKLSRYLFTITAINAGLGVSIGLAMWALGMPSPILFGVIGFLFNFAPYVGAIAGTSIAIAVGLVSLETIGGAFGVGAVYFTLTSIEGQLVTPYFVGRNLRLNTVIVFVWVMFWAWLWSAVGILVATPLLVSVRVFCDHIPALSGVGRFLSDRGKEEEAAEEYLSAGSEREAPAE